MAKVFIGTSGWQYSHWRGNFYPQDLPYKDWLRYYSKYFDSVEVNSSFYQQTRASTFTKWQSETPKNFIFSIKGNRFITHIKRLKDVSQPLKLFFDAANSLATKDQRHVILWQLPPSLKKDTRRLEDFLKLLPKTFRHALEFRHESWVDKETWEILKKHNGAAVFQDWKEWPVIDEVTADFVYIRFHGNKILYTSGYTEGELDEWERKMKQWLRQGLDIYAYFNNDALGFAIDNAKSLKKLLE